ncbi:MAG: hypothetical protein IJT44_09630 [Clostridia bacterium]|nr:hypothetical protein [Clostridia bacterium]
MKKISVFFCTVCVGLLTSFAVFADVIGPRIPVVDNPDPKSIWAVIVSAVVAVATYIWHLLTQKK